MSEHDANRALTDTARLRALPGDRTDVAVLTETYFSDSGALQIPVVVMTRGDIKHRQREARAMCRPMIHTEILTRCEALERWPVPGRERRKASTVARPEAHRLDAVSERDQSAVESGVWPKYTP